MSRLVLVLGLVSSLVTFAFGDPTMVSTTVADRFDFPVGAPNADGYQKSRGFNIRGHLGEDWVSAAGPGAIYRAPVTAVGTLTGCTTPIYILRFIGTPRSGWFTWRRPEA
jgi:hypothetical protein